MVAWVEPRSVTINPSIEIGNGIVISRDRNPGETVEICFPIDDGDDLDARLSGADGGYFGNVRNAIKCHASDAARRAPLRTHSNNPSFAWRKNLKE